MKNIIINIPEGWSEDKSNSMIQAAFNQGFTNFFATGDPAKKIMPIERCTLYSTDHNLTKKKLVVFADTQGKINLQGLNINEIGIRTQISSKDDEERAIKWATEGTAFLICKATDWKIIPFENLIARLSTLDTELYADVGQSLKDAEILLHTLETGVDGLVFTPINENDLIELKKFMKLALSLTIEKATIEKITLIPEADRVCVDTSSMLRAGEGMLVGSTAMGFALVHAEVFDSEFVNSRPFRVNAGDVSAYILVPQENPDGSLATRTSYLSELKAGSKVIVSNIAGELRIVFVGRVKIETRPMILFNLAVKRETHTIPINICIQNAETVRVVRADGVPISGTELKVGDEILVNVGPGATHFGTTIKETIIEK
jgi:3-dehydroquinate synthase II